MERERENADVPGGYILERGTHAELLAANGGYAEMWALQQSAAE